MPLTQETLAQLPACVAAVVRDYATGNSEQRWELRKCSFDLDAIDNLPCAKRSLIEIWVPDAPYWLRRDRNGGISLAPVNRQSQGEEQDGTDTSAWIVERTATRHAHVVVWAVAVVRTDTKR